MIVTERCGRNTSPIRLIAALGLIGIGTSCNRNDGLVPVAGVVKYRDATLSRGQVVFTPPQGTVAVGNIESDGTFVMKTGGRAGVAIGPHRVTVHSRRQPTAEEAQKLAVTESLIPEKYSRQDQSPLTYEVQAGPNEFRIELE
jgi:hypothetical protein